MVHHSPRFTEILLGTGLATGDRETQPRQSSVPPGSFDFTALKSPTYARVKPTVVAHSHSGSIGRPHADASDCEDDPAKTGYKVASVQQRAERRQNLRKTSDMYCYTAKVTGIQDYADNMLAWAYPKGAVVCCTHGFSNPTTLCISFLRWKNEAF